MAEGPVIVGAGGHAKVVLDAVETLGVAVSGAIDDDPALDGAFVLSVPVIGDLGLVQTLTCELIHGIGDNAVRERVSSTTTNRWLQVVHPWSSVSSHASLAAGVVVLAGAVIQCDASIGEGAIVNSGAIVEHDVEIGAFSHVAPHATVTGGASVGRRVLVGAGATVLPGVHVGDDATIGAGAVVIRNVRAGATVAGNPAAEIAPA